MSNNMLPPPPVFKPKFVSSAAFPLEATPASADVANSSSNSNSNSNSNFLTSSFIPNEDYNNNRLFNHSPSISPMTRFTNLPLPNDSDSISTASPTNSRKRRKSSLTLSSKDDIERKKKELKTQHSIIEKRRRIKMNREFDALKFLVPACRINILSGLNAENTPTKTNLNDNFDNSNMMHKLTILQSTVEYIKYLHLIIKLMKLQMLKPKSNRKVVKNWLKKNNNLNFINFDLDLQKFRDLNVDFNLNNLFLEINKNNGNVPNDWLDPITLEIENLINSKDEDDDNVSNIDQPRALSVSPTLRDKINENSNYRRSILQLQNDSKSFKLPLPAIIDKHIDIPQLNALPISKTPSSSSVSSITSPTLLHRQPSLSAPISAPGSFSTKYTYAIPNTVSAVSQNVIQCRKQSADSTPVEDIHAASHVLVGLKSNVPNSKRHPSIQNILN